MHEANSLKCNMLARRNAPIETLCQFPPRLCRSWVLHACQDSAKANSRQHPAQNGNQDIDRHPISNHLTELSVTDVRSSCILNELMRQPLQAQHLTGGEQSVNTCYPIPTAPSPCPRQTWNQSNQRLYLSCSFLRGKHIKA